MSKQKQKEKEITDLIEKGNYEYFKHNYDKSFEIYSNILEKNKNLSDELISKIEFKISLIFKNIQFWDEEIKHLDIAILKTKNLKEKYLIKKSSALMRLQNFEEAKKILISLNENSDEIKRLKIICDQKLNFEKEHPFSFIPEDIWINIFLFLDLKKINNLSLGLKRIKLINLIIFFW